MTSHHNVLLAGVFHTGDTPCSGHGRCSGSGTNSGTGQCLCYREWMGEDCDVNVAAVAGGSLGGLVVLATICVLVFCKRRLRRMCDSCCCRCCTCCRDTSTRRDDNDDDVLLPGIGGSGHVINAGDGSYAVLPGGIVVAAVASPGPVSAADFMLPSAYRPPPSAPAPAAVPNNDHAARGATVPADECTVCLSSPTDTVLGCGHMFCSGCAARVAVCPHCRATITQRIRVFR